VNYIYNFQIKQFNCKSPLLEISILSNIQRKLILQFQPFFIMQTKMILQFQEING